MAIPYTDTPKVGVDLNSTFLAADIASGVAQSRHRLGSQVWDVQGRRRVYARANATIAANNTAVTISPTTFLATASGGAYSPPAAMATGDEGWFIAASV